MRFLSISFLFISLISLKPVLAANEDLHGYCFPPETKLTQVKSALEPILLPKDEVQLDNGTHCLEVNLSAQRAELFDNFLKRDFIILRSYKGSAAAGKDQGSLKQCRVEIIQESDNKVETTTAGAGKKIQFKTQQSDISKSKKSMLMLSDGLPGNLEIYKTSVDLICFVKNDEIFDVVVQIQGRKGRLSTQLMLNKGQKFNLGEVVTDLKRSDKTVEVGKEGVSVSETSADAQDRYFITVF